MASASSVRRLNIPTGDAGTDVTVDLMARMAMGIYGAQSVKIRQLAIDIVRAAGVRQKDRLGEVRAIHSWVQQRLRYVQDPAWQELLTHAETLAFDAQDGDCDDHSILEAALLGAIGIPTRFVVVGMKRDAPFQHVYSEAMVMKTWVPLDAIMKDKPAGWSVPNPGRRKAYAVNSPDGVLMPDLMDMLGIAGCAWCAWMVL